MFYEEESRRILTCSESDTGGLQLIYTIFQIQSSFLMMKNNMWSLLSDDYDLICSSIYSDERHIYLYEQSVTSKQIDLARIVISSGRKNKYYLNTFKSSNVQLYGAKFINRAESYYILAAD